MGTNYYFRKKSVDPAHFDAITDSLNAEHKALIAKYNEKLHDAFSEMGIESFDEFDDSRFFVSPFSHSDCDIHVGKISAGWKPSMQVNKHFHSIATLKQFYEQNKHEYNFINEYGEVVSFENYLQEIKELNSDDSRKAHSNAHGADGYDWLRTEFS